MLLMHYNYCFLSIFIILLIPIVTIIFVQNQGWSNYFVLLYLQKGTLIMRFIMSLILEIKVNPCSAGQKIILDKSGKLKCFLKNPPEKGKANKELIHYLAKLLNISQNDIEILSGLTGRKKRIKINKALNYNEFLSEIGIDNQLVIK